MFKFLLIGVLLGPLAFTFPQLRADDPVPQSPAEKPIANDAAAQQELAGWGKIIDPEGKCEFVVGEDELLVKLSGEPRDLSAERNHLNAPRVMQTLEGDFAITTTIDGNLPLPQTDQKSRSAYISGGLLLMLDDNNYVRLERASFSRNGQENYYANFEMWNEGRSVRMGRFADFPLKPEQPVELRLELKQNNVRALVRHQGDNWHELGAAKIPPHEQLLAGVHTINSTGQPVSVRFSGFFLAAPFDVAEAHSRSPIRLLTHATKAAMIGGPRIDPELNELREAVSAIRRRAQSIATMSKDEKNQLILDARILVVSDSQYAPQMVTSVAGGLSKTFEQAGDWQSAISTYRAFANALAESENELLRRQANSMISAAQALENKYQE